MREPLRDDFGAVLEDLIERTTALTAHPYVLLGHSMGASLAFELGRHWSSWGRAPEAVILVGRSGPTARRVFPDIHQLAMPAFLDKVRELGGTPPQLFEHPELINLFAPVLRADFTVSETYRPLPGDPLTCPVWVCAGLDDPMVDERGLRDWDEYADGPVKVDWLPGGHFVLDDPGFHTYVAEVLASVAERARTQRAGAGRAA